MRFHHIAVVAAVFLLACGAARAISCEECQDIVGAVVDVAVNKTTLNVTVHDLEALCAAIFANDTIKAAECEVLVGIGGDLLPFVVKELYFLGWNAIPLVFCADIVNVCTEPCCELAAAPEQLHLSYADPTDLSQMRVTWVTLQDTPGGMVQWWATGQPGTLNAGKEETRTYTVGGWIGVVHTAVMTGLAPGANYTYRVGSALAGWSANVTFATLPANAGTAARPLRVVALADMGYGNNSDATVASLTALVDAGEVDVVLHNGDVSYADGYMIHWDAFWRKVEPIASRVPYMTTPGNHELWFNFTAYKVRTGMSMPAAGAGAPEGAMYYTLKLGTAQFVMLNSETPIDTADIDATQVAWLRQQLAAANANRAAVPWLTVLHHRPLYCTGDKSDCVDFAALLRDQVEQAYHDAKVDLGLAGHMHLNSRMYPVFNGTKMADSYDNPPATVYYVNGGAGNREGQTTFHPDFAPWAAWGTSAFGYLRLDYVAAAAAGGTHSLRIRVIDATTETVADDTTITKTAA